MEDLNIKPVLLDQESPVHKEKIFDSTSESSTLCLMPGRVIDTSKVRGQLIGMVKNKFSYVSHKPMLYEVIKNLSARSNPCPLVHIRGNEHVGKTRFVQEVCLYFY